MSLTAAQLTTLGTDIAANNNTAPGTSGPISALVHSQDNADAVAQWYNLVAAGPFVVWRDLSMDVVLGLIVNANMTPLDDPPTDIAAADYLQRNALWQARDLACQGKALNLQNLTISRSFAPMKRSGYRTALQDALTNLPAGTAGAKIAAGWVGVRDAAKFNSTNGEKLFATGTGTFSSPADLGYEGPIATSDVRAIWGI